MFPITLQTKLVYYSAILLFVAMGCAAIFFDMMYLLLLPLALLVAAVGFLRLDILFFAAAALVPLSINLTETPIGIGMSLPSEPIIFGAMLLVLLKFLTDNSLDRKFLNHPVSWLVYGYVGWMFITTLTSELPLVSFKYSLARFTFILVFYFYASVLFKKISNIHKFLWAYLAGFMLIIIYTTYNHINFHLTEQAAHFVMSPFYNDHTAYAAIIALYIPFAITGLVGYGFSQKYRAWCFLAAALLIIALILSYTRAAWVGIAAAFACSLVFIFKIHRNVILIFSILFLVLLGININQIILSFETNREQSSDDFGSHLQSITNVKTDPSNVERINRWNCALRMFEQRPITGWGPGTYQFIYGPFQLQKEKTVISTLSGNRGNAHSEYLGPLSEQGFPGPLLFIGLSLASVFAASRVFRKSSLPAARNLAAGILLGLVTYWVHGFLNNFLDTEKAAVPFFGFIAAIVSLEVFHRKADTPTIQ
ncbi:MAG: O-antigen ligase family protein [Bacteroidetes bacterium]|nr:O-antigen ligase family protein [Bacteroidota bacterium]